EVPACSDRRMVSGGALGQQRNAFGRQRRALSQFQSDTRLVGRVRVRPTFLCVLLEGSVAEGEAQTSREQHVVLLESWQRIAEVAIAIGDLPSEPVFNLGGSSGVELHAKFAAVGKVGEQRQLLA